MSWPEPGVRIVAQQPLRGGYVSPAVERLDLVDEQGRRCTVVRKQARPAEVSALRALAAVPGVARPELLAAGADWVVTPCYAGSPLPDAAPVPVEVYIALARVHAHYRGCPPPGLPVVDAEFWGRLCLDVARPAVRAAAQRTADRRLDAAAEALTAWAGADRVRRAVGLLDRTLCHGDAHRGNVLVGPDGATLIDWGNARAAPGGLDLAVLAAQGGTGEPHYRQMLRELGEPSLGPLLDVERQWSTLLAHVQYLGFAADHLGAARVDEMISIAARAFTRLDAALAF